MSVGNKESAQESIQVGQIRIRYLIDGSEAGGMGVFELSVPPKSIVPPPHSHTLNEECVYLLERTLMNPAPLRSLTCPAAVPSLRSARVIGSSLAGQAKGVTR